MGIQPRTFLLPARSVVFYQFVCVCECVRLTCEEAARATARRCNAPVCVCHRWAPEDGRPGRTAAQLCSDKEKRTQNMNIFYVTFFPQKIPAEKLRLTAIPAQIRPHQRCSWMPVDVWRLALQKPSSRDEKEKEADDAFLFFPSRGGFVRMDRI